MQKITQTMLNHHFLNRGREKQNEDKMESGRRREERKIEEDEDEEEEWSSTYQYCMC